MTTEHDLHRSEHRLYRSPLIPLRYRNLLRLRLLLFREAPSTQVLQDLRRPQLRGQFWLLRSYFARRIVATVLEKALPSLLATWIGLFALHQALLIPTFASIILAVVSTILLLWIYYRAIDVDQMSGLMVDQVPFSKTVRVLAILSQNTLVNVSRARLGLDILLGNLVIKLAAPPKKDFLLPVILEAEKKFRRYSATITKQIPKITALEHQKMAACEAMGIPKRALCDHVLHYSPALHKLNCDRYFEVSRELIDFAKIASHGGSTPDPDIREHLKDLEDRRESYSRLVGSRHRFLMAVQSHSDLLEDLLRLARVRSSTTACGLYLRLLSRIAAEGLCLASDREGGPRKVVSPKLHKWMSDRLEFVYRTQQAYVGVDLHKTAIRIAHGFTSPFEDSDWTSLANDGRELLSVKGATLAPGNEPLLNSREVHIQCQQLLAFADAARFLLARAQVEVGASLGVLQKDETPDFYVLLGTSRVAAAALSTLKGVEVIVVAERDQAHEALAVQEIIGQRRSGAHVRIAGRGFLPALLPNNAKVAILAGCEAFLVDESSTGIEVLSKDSQQEFRLTLDELESLAEQDRISICSRGVVAEPFKKEDLASKKEDLISTATPSKRWQERSHFAALSTIRLEGFSWLESNSTSRLRQGS